ncbi:MAG TPA: prenyltransferase/squalene oxidase repeat-containing protein [Chloroflexia bacterium]|nr:prenyltransferase/squalene oxidase repeat-containing protein [Chloroflexia bacterium]
MNTHATRTRAALAVFTALLALVWGAGQVFAQSTYVAPANRAVEWMKTQQQPDGSFAGFGAGSTADAVLAIVAAGRDPGSYQQGGNTPVTFLQSKAVDLAKTAGGAGKLLVAVRALGMDGRQFGGVDLVQSIRATESVSVTGQYGPDLIGHAFAVLGLRAAREQVPPAAIERIKTTQTAAGGWAFTGDTAEGSADTNTTAVVLQALVAAGAAESEAAMTNRAVEYLLSQQNTDGGWPYQKGGEFGSDSDANSTSYVVQALAALNNDEDAERGRRFLLTLQTQSGAFGYSAAEAADNAGATYQAVHALLGATLVDPVAAPLPVPPTAPIGEELQPGMPRTGAGVALPVLVLVLSALALGGGLAVRRRSAA